MKTMSPDISEMSTNIEFVILYYLLIAPVSPQNLFSGKSSN